MKQNLVLGALLLLVVPALGAKDNAGATRDTSAYKTAPGKGYVYKEAGGKPLDMEIYFPAGWEPKKQSVPGVILFHGGGWSGGTLDQFRHACAYYASRGLVAATVNYRLRQGKETCVTDAKSAIRWMKQHAQELGIDPKRIIAGGGSAGGHIAILATIAPGLNDPQDPADIDTSVVAYLLFNPAFSPKDVETPSVCVLDQIKAPLAPAIFMFGVNDKPWKPGGDAVVAKLKTLGDKDLEYWVAPGQTHGFFNTPPWGDVALGATDQFLVRHQLLTGESSLAAPATGEKLVTAP